jgi:hypothetical protein
MQQNKLNDDCRVGKLNQSVDNLKIISVVNIDIN